MTEDDLQKIEKSLGIGLPASYRATLLNYPFGPDSLASCMLFNDADDVISLNRSEFSFSEVGKPLFIGNDGEEERYFVDAERPDSLIFAYEIETGRHRVIAATWATYLDHILATDAAADADEEAARESHAKRKWWEFWK